MQAYFGERAKHDQASAILDSNSEEAWEETKKHPRECYIREHTENAFTAGYVAKLSSNIFVFIDK